MRPSLPLNIVLMALLGLLCLSVFLQTTSFEFTNLDDNVYVTANPAMAMGLSPAGLRWAFTTRLGDLWMPVTWISFLADHQFFGASAAAYHRTNMALHLTNTLLLYLVLLRLTGARWRAALVAALFAVHPLHVESVAWVAERKDVLSALFFLLALWFYAGRRRDGGRAGYLAALGCFALALMSKPMTVTLPAVLLLIDFWSPDRRRPLRRLLLEKIPFLVLAAAVSLATVHFVQTRDIGAPQPLPLLERLGRAVVYYTLYLGRMLRPVDLSSFYPPAGLRFGGLQVALAVLLLAGLTATAWRGRRHLLPVWLGWLWYLVMLLPVLDVLQGGMQLMSDRYFYLPSIGLFVALAWLAQALVRARPALRHIVPILAVASVLTCAFVAHRQTRVWRDSGTLFTHALAVNDADYLAHLNLGKWLDDAGRSQEALPHLQRAAALFPDPKYLVNLADTLRKLGRAAEAIPHYREAVRRRPDFPSAHNNLGIALVATGDWQGAGEQFALAVQQDPGYADAITNLAMVQAHGGQITEAVAGFRRALALDPGNQHAAAMLKQLAGKP